MGRKPDPNSLTNRIIKACNVPRGLDLPEITAQVQAAATVVYAVVRLLVLDGRLHRAGTRRLYRYFAQAHQAEQYQQVFAAEREQILRAKLRHKQDRLNITRRNERRCAQGLPPLPLPSDLPVRIHGSDRYTARILELCARPGGVLCSEIKAAIQAPLGTLSNKLRKLSQAGTLHRRGEPRQYRYFTHQAHAEAWEHGQVSKPAPARKPKHGPPITIGTSKSKDAGQPSIAQATSVTWPAHVQIQRAPVCRDNRYTFTPPPGWRGELMQEWQQRRRA